MVLLLPWSGSELCDQGWVRLRSAPLLRLRWIGRKTLELTWSDFLLRQEMLQHDMFLSVACDAHNRHASIRAVVATSCSNRRCNLLLEQLLWLFLKLFQHTARTKPLCRRLVLNGVRLVQERHDDHGPGCCGVICWAARWARLQLGGCWADLGGLLGVHGLRCGWYRNHQFWTQGDDTCFLFRAIWNTTSS